MTADPEPTYLSATEAAQVIGIGESSVRRAAEAGRLRYTAGRHGERRFALADVEAYRDAREAREAARSLRATAQVKAPGSSTVYNRFDIEDTDEL